MAEGNEPEVQVERGEALPAPVPDDGDALLTPAEVGALWRVDPKTVSRWAKKGRLSAIRTPGGHRRFRLSEVRELLRRPADPAA